MKTYVNMLPVSYLRARLVRRRLALWLLVWGIIVVIGAASWWSSYIRCVAAAQRYDICKRRYAPVQKRLADNQAMQRQIDELGKRESMLGELHDQHPPLTALGIVSRCASRCNARLRIEKLVMERKNSVSAGRANLATAAAASLLTLEGKGADNLAIATFTEALRDSAAFARVDLKSTIRTGAETDDMRHFIITCEF